MTVTSEQPDHTGTADLAAEVDDGLAIPDWEIALTEVAQRLPVLDADLYPNPLSVSVTTFMRHLLDTGPGPVPSSGDGVDRSAAIAGGIEGWLHRLASAERAALIGFLHSDIREVQVAKEEWGHVFQQVIEPLVRQETTWGVRRWPTTLKDQVALLAEYLSKDPAVLPAVMAAVALGVPSPKTRASRAQLDRRNQQVERLLTAYFNGRGRSSYCDFVHATAAAGRPRRRRGTCG